MDQSRLIAKDPMLRLARELGFAITPGRRHWHACHPSGGRTIIPFGRKRHDRAERNITAALRRAARCTTSEPSSPSTTT